MTEISPSAPRPLLRGVQIAAILDFAAFVISSILLGGDAVSGKVMGGRYFLNAHGHFTEVSPTIFWGNLVHGYSVVAMALLYIFLVFRSKRSAG